MTDTSSARNRFREQSLGSNINLWGAPYLNQFMDSLDESLDGQVTIDCTASSPITLTASNFIAGQQAHYRYLILTGALTNDVVLIVPSVQKWYVVINATTGNHIVQLQTASAGTLTTLAQNRRTIVFSNGTNTSTTEIPLNLIDAPFGNLALAGFKITGLGLATAGTDAASLNNSLDQFAIPAVNLNLNGHKVTNLGLATASTDAASLANRIDQFSVPTGPLNLNNQNIINLLDPTTAQMGATKNYVDTRTLDWFVPPIGTVNFNNQFLSNLKNPSLSLDAVNLQTLSAAIAAATFPVSPGTLRVSVTDTTAKFLSGAFDPQIRAQVKNPAGDERLMIYTNFYPPPPGII